MEELCGFTLSKLYEKINWKIEEFIEWLQHLKLYINPEFATSVTE